MTLSVTCSLGTNWISQAMTSFLSKVTFSQLLKIKHGYFFGLSKAVISLFCSQNYWKLISNTALYGAQIYKPFLNAINGAIERTQNEKKRNIWHIWSFPVLIFPKKSRWDTHPASPHPFKKVPETFLSSFLYHPEMVFSFSLKQWAKVLSAVTKKICDFRTITSKVSTNMWVSDSVLSKSKKMCIKSNNEMSWKKWALYYRLHCTTKDIKSVPHTASCLREWPKQNIGTWQWIRRTFLFD